MEDEREARVELLDKFQGPDELLGANLLRVELGGCGRDESEAVGDLGQTAAGGQARKLAAVEKLRQVGAGGFVDLLRHREL